MNEPKHVAVAGATGAVGIEILNYLEQRDFPVGELTLLASARSAGKTLTFKGQEIEIKELTKDSFKDVWQYIWKDVICAFVSRSR